MDYPLKGDRAFQIIENTEFEEEEEDAENVEEEEENIIEEIN